MANQRVLHRFWIEFDRTASAASRLTPHVGVTAFDVEDAKFLLEQRLFDHGLPPIVHVVEDIDVSTLDPGKVLIRMAPPNQRGVWYPLGYEL
jgi:hypothetical protein